MSMGVLEGKVAIITGSSRGLGYAIARRYAEEGAAVVVSSRTDEAAKAAASELTGEGLRAIGRGCDVSDLSQVRALATCAIDEFGGFDVWVNNAGISSPYGPTVEVPPDSVAAVVHTNILGTYYGSIVALQHLLPKRQGKLINMLGRSYNSYAPMQSTYSASKAWVYSFTRALAKENADSGVSIIAFSPGMVDTAMLRKPHVIEGYERRMDGLKAVYPVLVSPPEVPAEKALWVASAATDGKTGKVYKVLGTMDILLRFLQEGLRRMAGRRQPPVEMDISSVPPAYRP